MILSFKDRKTELIWNQEKSRRIPDNIQQVALRKLYILNRSKDLNDLMVPPGNKLEKLSGNRAGQDSTAFESMIYGESAFPGLTDTLLGLSLLIIIMRQHNGQAL